MFKDNCGTAVTSDRAITISLFCLKINIQEELAWKLAKIGSSNNGNKALKAGILDTFPRAKNVLHSLHLACFQKALGNTCYCPISL